MQLTLVAQATTRDIFTTVCISQTPAMGKKPTLPNARRVVATPQMRDLRAISNNFRNVMRFRMSDKCRHANGEHMEIHI